MNKLGIYLGVKKQEALFHGDTTDAVVHRYFIYGFQAVGMHFSTTPDVSPAMVLLQARYGQKAWETLIEIHRTDYQSLKAQGFLLFVYALVVTGFLANAQLYLSKVCKLIDKENLKFLPMHGRPAELSDEFREEAAVLSQTIYLENYLHLTLGGPTPVMTARIQREFRSDLQVRIIQWFSL